MSRRLRFGPHAPPLADQLPGLPDAERWQALSDALALVSGEVLSRAEGRAARDRLEAAVRAAARSRPVLD